MAASRKKAILRYLSGEWLAGYIAPESCLEGTDATQSPDGLALPWLDLSGKVVSVSLASAKWLCFVRDFQSGDPAAPERLLRKNFTGRPRGEGLWLRLRLADDDAIEGLAANDRSLLSPVGLLLTPPDTRSNTQRLFVPRHSIAALEVLGVLRPAGKKREPVVMSGQDTLFPGATDATG